MKNVPIIVFLLVALGMASCGPRKNTALSRNYQAFITRYNIYYNGDEHYKITMNDLENAYRDDYTRLLFVHPTDAKGVEGVAQPQGDFTRSIEKAQKAIQLRSIKKKPARKPGKSTDPKYKEWMRREEYNPFLHNAWMMLGKSQFNNGDFLGAASTFYYISKHFSWLPSTVTEARLWQARAYCDMGWDYEAENILVKTPKDQLVNKELKRLYNMAYAALYLRGIEPQNAIPYIKDLIPLSSGAQKSRLNFLLGQLYARENNKRDAYRAFKRAASASVSYRTQFNARIKQSEVYEGENIKPEVDALKRMTRYDRNKEYLDQIYYAIGNLYLSRRDTASAIDNYKLALEKSTRNGVEKAICQITLGNLYFDRGEYDLAQPCYSEAVPVLPEDYPDRELLSQRSDVLDELAIYTQNVNLNDSLLRLSDMTHEQQLAVVNKIIDDLNKKEKEEAEKQKREEYLAQQQANGSVIANTGNAASAPATYVMNTDDSWYFYNSATLAAGKTDFQKRWGSRKLEDDWRRRNKSSFSFDEFENNDAEEEADEVAEDTDSHNAAEESSSKNDPNDPHFPEYYLKQIPSTPQEKITANDVIQEGMYNIGIILKDKLDAYDDAADEWNKLLKRYPDNVYRLDIYYNMYLMYMRIGDKNRAEHYRALMLSDFPESKYGMAVRDPNYIENLRKMDSEQNAIYEKAYAAYLDNRNDEVHDALALMLKKYPLSKIMPKFMFIDALSYVTENNQDKFKEVLTMLLERYPESDVSPLASDYMRGLSQGRKLHSGVSNSRGMLWDMRLGNDSLSVEGDSVEFDLNPDDPQLLVLVYPTYEVSGNQLLFDVARHNFSSFVVKDYDLEPMNFGRLGLLLVKGFANFDELVHYRSVMASGLELPDNVRPVMISVKNFDTLLQHGRTFEEYFRYVDEQAAEAPVGGGPGLADEDYGSMIVRDRPEEIPEDDGDELELEEPKPSVPEKTEVQQPDIEPAVPDTVKPADVDSIKPLSPGVAVDTVAIKVVPDSLPVREKPGVPVKPEVPVQKQQPAAPAKPKVPVKPVAPKPSVYPAYPAGSEGDDDLLDN
ncbi:MAG: tetratricopeptide repeat protein [Bacteroides sp.]|nr:tetratricopeptide repeat protein [Bacteroides sp.]MCM1390561.1 tetratricopeptide repeat protein [Bacteroides sp.]